jgi:hypothetical protein
MQRTEKILIQNENDLRKLLVHEALSIPTGSFKQVFFDSETKELSFSSPMTGNSWVGTAQTTSSDTIGFLDALDFDIEGFKRIDDNFVEIDDDAGETEEDFKNTEYERYYKNSSIVNIYEAENRMVDYAIQDEWFQEIVNAYQMEIVDKDKDEEVAQ